MAVGKISLGTKYGVYHIMPGILYTSRKISTVDCVSFILFSWQTYRGIVCGVGETSSQVPSPSNYLNIFTIFYFRFFLIYPVLYFPDRKMFWLIAAVFPSFFFYFFCFHEMKSVSKGSLLMSFFLLPSFLYRLLLFSLKAVNGWNLSLFPCIWNQTSEDCKFVRKLKFTFQFLRRNENTDVEE